MHKALCMETVLILETKRVYLQTEAAVADECIQFTRFFAKYFLQRLLVKKHNL
jgi:hypothetical protein